MTILQAVEGIIRDVFAEPAVNIDRDTVAADVPGWDSLSHVRLLLAIENHFKIKFKPLEASRIESVGQLTDVIAEKIR